MFSEFAAQHRGSSTVKTSTWWSEPADGRARSRERTRGARPGLALLLQTSTRLLSIPPVSDLDRAVSSAPLIQSGRIGPTFFSKMPASPTALPAALSKSSSPDFITFGTHPISRSRLWVDRKISNIFG
jgi:hypothetical protein